jgi:hypothetical protein
MSHGGFGGGGGHGGFGHGGGHSGFGHGGHHGVGHGVSVGHGLGLGGGHHGTVVGHILHALGLGQHGHHHGVAGAHHPDQSPTWNQAMQGEKRPGFFLRVDKRPFMVLFLLVFTSFFWLWIVYNVHHSESSHNNNIDLRAQSGIESVPAQQAAPGTEAYAQAQNQAMQNYAAQYMSAATANGAAQMYNPTGMAGTGYGGTMAPSAGVSAVTPYGMPSGGYSAYGAAGAPGAYGAPAAFPARQQGFGYYPNGQVQFGYAPTANGRARLVVPR